MERAAEDRRASATACIGTGAKEAVKECRVLSDLLRQSRATWKSNGGAARAKWNGFKAPMAKKTKAKTPIMTPDQERFMAVEGLTQWTQAVVTQSARISTARDR